MPLTEPQKRAVETIDRPVAVTAGPGSGKTRVLVDRYLYILETSGADIENIVAITFTKKAASEMRERVRHEMDGQIRKAESPEGRSRWRQRRRKLDSAVISTIHGFCTRLLRDYPVEARIDPAFSTLDSFAESEMKDAAVNAAVTGRIDAGSNETAQLVAAFSRAGLVGAIERILATTRSLGIPFAEVFERTSERLASESAWEGAIGEIDATISGVLETIETFPDRTKTEQGKKEKARERLQEFLDAWQQYRKELGDIPTAETIADLLALLRDVGRTLPDRRMKDLTRPYVDDLHGRIGKQGDSGVLAGIAMDLVGRSYLLEIKELVATTEELYTAEKRAASALDYEDLQLAARDLLVGHPEIAEQVRRRFRFVLVDEYQDTNGLQRDIITQVVGREHPSNLFIVGDPKQSVYGFRGAEVQVFEETAREIADRQGGERVHLDTNFRSDGRIVGLVRDLFDLVMRPPESLMEDDRTSLGFVPFHPDTAEHEPGQTSPVVDVIVATEWKQADGSENGTEPEDGDVASAASGGDGDDTPDAEAPGGRELEAELLAMRLRELVTDGEPFVRDKDADDKPIVRACRYGDVALLLRARTNIKVYERAFRRARIPFYVVAGKGFYDRPETRDLLELLRFLDNGADEVPLAAVLRSPMFGISDETLIALRSDRLAAAAATGRAPRTFEDRPLWDCVVGDRRSGLVDPDQAEALDRTVAILTGLRSVRNRLGVAALLQRAIRTTEFDTVSAAAEDGPQRLSNIEKLIDVARAFERGGGRLLADFAEFVREFRRLESDEAEASIRPDADAVAIMTAHKSKGLEFPVVAIADLHGQFRNVSDVVLVEREWGLGFDVPDGTGRRRPTQLFAALAERARLRGRFELMRLFFVAATRARDRLILSAAPGRVTLAADGAPVVGDPDKDRSWFQWLLRAMADSDGRFDLEGREAVIGESRLRLIREAGDIGHDRADGDAGARQSSETATGGEPAASGDAPGTGSGPGASLPPDEAGPDRAVARVAELLRPVAPTPSPVATRFAVTSLASHAVCPRRFQYTRLLRIPDLGEAARVRDVSERPETTGALVASLRGLVVHRFCETLQPDELPGDRLERAVADVRRDRGDPYADVFARHGDAAIAADSLRLAECYAASALRRRIDGLDRVRGPELVRATAGAPASGFVVSEMGFALRFADGTVVGSVDKLLLEPDGSGGWRAEVVDFKTNRIAGGSERAAALEELERTYRFQMQAYALAAWRLVPGVTSVRAVLVALDAGPDAEVEVPDSHIAEPAANEAVRALLASIRSAGTDPSNFPARPGELCRTCAYATICPEGAALVEGDAAGL